MLNLIINALSFVITVIGFLVGLKSKERPTVTLEKHIHIHSHSYVRDINTSGIEKRPKSVSPKSDHTGEQLVAAFFVVVMLGFVYIRFAKTLELVIALTSILLTSLITILSYHYSQDTKEELKNYIIISQTFFFEITSLIYLSVLNLNLTEVAFYNALSLREFIGLAIAHILEAQTMVALCYGAFSTAFYILQIGAILIVFMRLGVTFFNIRNPYICRVAMGNWGFIPNIAIGFLWVFLVYFKFLYPA